MIAFVVRTTPGVSSMRPCTVTVTGILTSALVHGAGVEGMSCPQGPGAKLSVSVKSSGCIEGSRTQGGDDSDNASLTRRTEGRKHQRPRILRTFSRFTGEISPRSVTMPVMSSAGVTSNAGQ